MEDLSKMTKKDMIKRLIMYIALIISIYVSGYLLGFKPAENIITCIENGEMDWLLILWDVIKILLCLPVSFAILFTGVVVGVLVTEWRETFGKGDNNETN